MGIMIAATAVIDINIYVMSNNEAIKPLPYQRLIKRS